MNLMMFNDYEALFSVKDYNEKNVTYGTFFGKFVSHARIRFIPRYILPCACTYSRVVKRT